MSASFLDLATTAQAVAGTSKKLAKAALLADHWRPLDDDDLALSARFLASQIFPSWDGRTLGVGAGTLIKHLYQVTAVPEVRLRELTVQRGDLGDAAEEIWPHASVGVTVAQVAEVLTQLADTRSTARRTTLLDAFLERLGGLEAKYFVRLLMRDLRIGLREGAALDALSRCFGRASEQVAWAHMLLGDIGETALLARADRLASAQLRLHHPLGFMLASPVPSLPALAEAMPGPFAVEDKYDGMRAQAHLGLESVHGGSRLGMVTGGVRVTLFSRTLDDVTQAFPELVTPLAAMLLQSGVSALVLDGEVLAMASGRALNFTALQRRFGRRAPKAELLAEVPVVFMAFDVLCRADTPLFSVPYEERRACLVALPTQAPHVQVAPATVTDDALSLDATFAAARARGNEGLMIKALTSTYRAGRRGGDWLKVKRPQASLDVVITAAEYGHGKRHKVLSDYTFAVRKSLTDDALVNVGKAYSGLTDREIEQLTPELVALTTDTLDHGKRLLLRPAVVLEITFDRVQVSDRHQSGYALRFPRIVRLRPDKPVAQIDVLATVAALADGAET